MRTILKRHYEQTPIRIKKIGDSILYGSTLLVPIIMGSPMTDNHKAWAVTALSLFGAAGKFISNLFTETPSSVNPPDNG